MKKKFAASGNICVRCATDKESRFAGNLLSNQHASQQSEKPKRAP